MTSCLNKMIKNMKVKHIYNIYLHEASRLEIVFSYNTVHIAVQSFITDEITVKRRRASI